MARHDTVTKRDQITPFIPHQVLTAPTDPVPVLYVDTAATQCRCAVLRLATPSGTQNGCSFARWWHPRAAIRAGVIAAQAKHELAFKPAGQMGPPLDYWQTVEMQ